MRPDEPTVFVVDDDEAMCEALTWLLESQGLSVATYNSAEDFLSAYDPARPGCLVVDVRMRGLSGLELQARLVEQGCPLPIIILTGHGDVPMAVRAVKAGAFDFLEKPVDDQRLLERIRAALALDAERRQAALARQLALMRLQTLTAREQQVLDLVVAGKPSKLIAFELGIAEKTVEVHRQRVMQKLEVRGVVELVHLVLSLERRDHGPT